MLASSSSKAPCSACVVLVSDCCLLANDDMMRLLLSLLFFVFFFYTQGCCLAVYMMFSNECTLFCFLFASVLFFFLSFSGTDVPFFFWLGRALPPASWPPCPSGQPWRKLTGPLPCLTPACSSTNRPWPTCSFNSRLRSSHQVWLAMRPPRGRVDKFARPGEGGCVKMTEF